MDRSAAEDNLLRFRMAMELSGDSIFLVDRETLRFVDFNERACKASGYTREELLKKSPLDILEGTSREQLEATYDKLIAMSPSGIRSEVSGLAKDGKRSLVELQRRAVKLGERWVIATISRDVTRRKAAELATQALSRMYAALNATNEAILRATSPAELYQRVCDAAVQQGSFLFAGVATSADGRELQVIAAAGTSAEKLRNVRLSVDPASPEGQGMAAIAWRTRRAAVANDVQTDERSRRWHADARAAGVGSTAAVPVVKNGQCACVLTFHLKEAGAFDEQTVALLERIAENVAYALANFEREAERRAAEAALRESEARFRSLTELSSDWYWELDAEFRFVRFEGQRHSGVAQSLATRHLGQRPWETGLQTDGEWDAFRKTCERHEPFTDFVNYRTLPDGTRRYTSVNGEPVFDADGRFRGYRGVGRDVTERRRAIERIQHLATHDVLTGLPNRMMFSQMLGVAIEASRRHERQLAVLFVDLDRFKAVNDTLGHEAGDEVLRAVTSRIKQSLRASDVVARMGGDEFVVLAQEVGSENDVADVAERILAAALRPVRTGGRECTVGASVGISMFPLDAVDDASLMKNADTAMYAAKQAGRSCYRFYGEPGTRRNPAADSGSRD